MVPSTTVVTSRTCPQRSSDDWTASQMACMSTTSHLGLEGVSIQTMTFPRSLEDEVEAAAISEIASRMASTPAFAFVPLVVATISITRTATPCLAKTADSSCRTPWYTSDGSKTVIPPAVECAKKIEVTACIPEEKARQVGLASARGKPEHSSSNTFFSRSRRVGLSMRAYFESLCRLESSNWREKSNRSGVG